MSNRGLVALIVAGAAIGVAAAGSAAPTAGPLANAQAWAIRITIPGSNGASTTTVNAPPSGRSLLNGFSYPSNGSVLTTGAITVSATATTATNAAATAEADISTVSIFGGEITASSVTAHAAANTVGEAVSGQSITDGNVVGLNADGQTGTLGELPMTWGYVSISEPGIDTSAPAGSQGWNGFVTELHVHLDQPHGGLPAGSDIMIGFAKAQVQTAPAPPPVTTTTTTTTTPETIPSETTTTTATQPETTSTTPTLPVVTTPPLTTTTTPASTTTTATATTTTTPNKGPTGPPAPPVKIPTAQPALEAGPYVFPVYGQSSFTDTFGAPRADTVWNHGADILGQLGQPVLAVADGIVFSVGWNTAAGNRLWLQDAQGNDFYYANLSAFGVQITNGVRVKAGDVVGFMGATGADAGGTVHLHFEIHPVSLLNLGYDGAVNPTAYLDSWKRVSVLSVPIAAGWAPSPPGANAGPEPGAFLLGSSDISSADGLDPSSLERALVVPPAAAPAHH